MMEIIEECHFLWDVLKTLEENTSTHRTVFRKIYFNQEIEKLNLMRSLDEGKNSPFHNLLIKNDINTHYI